MNVAAARDEIQKAEALLINRFGHESDVLDHLIAARRHLNGIEGVAATGGFPATVIVATPVTTEAVGTAPAVLATDHGPSTKTTVPRRKGTHGKHD